MPTNDQTVPTPEEVTRFNAALLDAPSHPAAGSATPANTPTDHALKVSQLAF
jgi:hypothetical protein